MNNIKIAVPTNDKENIAERTGRARGFMIFELDNNKIIASTYRENPHKHHGEHNHNDVMGILDDCQFMIVVKVGKHFKQNLDSAKIEIKKTNKTNILDVVNDFILQ